MNLNAKIQQLRLFLHRERRMPTYREMLTLFGYRSTNSVAGLVRKLVEGGFILQDSQGHMAPTRKLTGVVKLLGTVQAGFPSPAEEELVDVLSLDEYLIRRPEATYLLTVTGDSMIDAGIHPGDIVLVEKGGTPRNGQIVVAQVDGEWTLKYYHKDRAGVRLDPANKKYSFIRPKHSLVIGGIVRGVVRRYD
ncbi:MAG: transcriptional repressor LexA [Kiritimatiellae bacterium]|nr:transcriptional repressor LexA [Kiritimatiellia bacterium]MDW8458117.1 transcriptional repressor LexA [Verrucomicrobiota bacterium]